MSSESYPYVGEKIKEQSLLFDISQTLDSSLDLRDTLGPVLSIIAKYKGIIRGSLNLLNRETGEIFPTFTVITTRANPMMEVIHNSKKRMPVILSPEEERTWLDISSGGHGSKVFDPFPQELMFAEKA